MYICLWGDEHAKGETLQKAWENMYSQCPRDVLFGECEFYRVSEKLKVQMTIAEAAQTQKKIGRKVGAK